MKKKTYWNAFFKKLGIEKSIGFLLSILLVIIGLFLNFKKFGFEFIFITFAYSYLYDNLKNLITTFKEVKKEYTIEEKK